MIWIAWSVSIFSSSVPWWFCWVLLVFALIDLFIYVYDNYTL